MRILGWILVGWSLAVGTFSQGADLPTVEQVKAAINKLPQSLSPIWDKKVTQGEVTLELPEFESTVVTALETQVYKRKIDSTLLKKFLKEFETSVRDELKERYLNSVRDRIFHLVGDEPLVGVRAIDDAQWKIDLGRVKKYYKNNFDFDVGDVAFAMFPKLTSGHAGFDAATAYFFYPTDDTVAGEVLVQRSFKSGDGKDTVFEVKVKFSLLGSPQIQREAVKLIFGTPHVVFVSQASVNSKSEPGVQGIVVHELGHHYIASKYPERYSEKGRVKAFADLAEKFARPETVDKMTDELARFTRSKEYKDFLDAWVASLRTRNLPADKLNEFIDGSIKSLPAVMGERMALELSQYWLRFEEEAYNFQIHFFKTEYRYDLERAMQSCVPTIELNPANMSAEITKGRVRGIPVARFLVLPSQRLAFAPLYDREPGR
jgi:hypothetical protein